MNHKDLDVWKEAMNLVKMIYEFTLKLPEEEKYGIISQLRRAVVSIPSNIAEGSSRKSDKELLYFLNISRGSLAEIETQLIIISSIYKIEDSKINDKIAAVGKLSNGLIKYLKNKNGESKLNDGEADYNTESSIHQSPITPDSYRDHYFAHETAVIDEGCQIGEGTKIWHFSHIMKDCVIGKGCNLGQNVVVSPNVVLGNNVKVQNNVSIYTGVICEDDVFLGPSMVFTNITNPRSAIIRRDQYEKTVVKKGASIGANATIVCGNNIGEYSFIGAGAVVTKEVKPYALIVGNPAKQIGWMSEYGHRLDFNDQGVAVCPESKEKYYLKDEIVKKNKD